MAGKEKKDFMMFFSFLGWKELEILFLKAMSVCFDNHNIHLNPARPAPAYLSRGIICAKGQFYGLIGLRQFVS